MDPLRSQLAALPRLEKLYDEIEQPLGPVLLEMEHLGVLIDAGRNLLIVKGAVPGAPGGLLRIEKQTK